jgi:hypothetical protein
MSTAPQVPIKPQGTKSPKTDFDAYYFVTFEEKYGDKTGTSVGITVYDEKFTPASGPGKHPFYGEKVNRAFEGGFECEYMHRPAFPIASQTFMEGATLMLPVPSR